MRACYLIMWVYEGQDTHTKKENCAGKTQNKIFLQDIQSYMTVWAPGDLLFTFTEYRVILRGLDVVYQDDLIKCTTTDGASECPQTLMFLLCHFTANTAMTN